MSLGMEDLYLEKFNIQISIKENSLTYVTEVQR